ncbi:serine/threonine-protein kinase [Streptomyces sp. NPDC048352]|uniref:serine/threonine-protein kinase n=1 Tax=Streptomyces sp. NPDC048352 TaxID=3154718 RepID=UPI0034151749
MTADSAPQPLRADDPRDIAGYRLRARIGEGGMGTVYLSHTRGGQPVALKVIRREFGREPEFRRRFEQEVQAARRVRGYHVVPVVDHDTGGELAWLATEFVPGLALHDALAGYGPLPPATVLRLVGCTARALSAIHSAGVVHRDLKPGNILLGADGPYVIDFGIARAADATQLTQSGGLIGTPQYMSPEQALGEQVGPAGDVFSLGLICAVAATGRHPYGDGGAITLAAQIANTALRPPRLDGYDDRLRPLLERCLAADPAARIGTGELAALCAESAGGALDDFTGWLPEPLTAEIARRARAVLPPAEPTVADGGPSATARDARFAAAPTRGPEDPAGSRATAGAPPGFPAPPAHAPHPTHAPHPPARRRPAAVTAGAVAAVLALAGAGIWGMTGGGDSPRDHQDGGQDDRQVTPKPGPPSPTPPPSSAPPEDAGYAVVFQDRPFALRSPGVHVVNVDLDLPKVFGPGDIATGEELRLSGISKGRWEFRTPTGKSSGKTPAECLQGARADVLPPEVPAADLRTTIPVGTLLCTQTSDGRLAMLEVTDITQGADKDLPDYATKLTLWKKR